jgi:hypothetical protein
MDSGTISLYHAKPIGNVYGNGTARISAIIAGIVPITVQATVIFQRLAN